MGEGGLERVPVELGSQEATLGSLLELVENQP